MSTAKANAVLVDALGSSLRYGGNALEAVPDLLKKLLAEEAWREFVTQRGELVQHERFADFVTTPPLKGLGASMELIDRIVGTSDPDLLRMLREAKKGKPGRPRKDTENGEDSTPISKGEDSTLTADRLAREAPEEYEAVRRGEKTIHAAAVAAGIRKRRISIRLDDPASAIRSIRNNASPEFWQEFRRLVNE